MSDYTTPAVTDKTAAELAERIADFNTDMVEWGAEIESKLDKILDRHYAVNHEPQVELPFDAEYEWVCDKVGNVNKYSHIFLSGYLPSGASLRFNRYSQSADTQDNYSALYINGQKINLLGSKEYICRAEAGGRERLNILILGSLRVGEVYKPRLAVNYADFPLEDFKMLVFDNNGDPVYPDVSSFCSSYEIDTLKYIGDMRWTSSDICTLRRLEVTGDMYVTGAMRCVCLRDLIIPNVINVPNTNVDCTQKPNLANVDISSVSGAVGNLCNARLGDVKLSCSSISNSGLNGSNIGNLDVGDRCVTIGSQALSGSTVTDMRTGRNVSTIGDSACSECRKLKSLTLDSITGISFGDFAFRNCYGLREIHFGKLTTAISNTFQGDTVITTVTFPPKSLKVAVRLSDTQYLTEQSCLNIVNAIADSAAVRISLSSNIKALMTSEWYCKLNADSYITCTAEDDGAITQAEALLARGGTLA